MRKLNVFLPATLERLHAQMAGKYLILYASIVWCKNKLVSHISMRRAYNDVVSWGSAEPVSSRFAMDESITGIGVKGSDWIEFMGSLSRVATL